MNYFPSSLFSGVSSGERWLASIFVPTGIVRGDGRAEMKLSNARIISNATVARIASTKRYIEVEVGVIRLKTSGGNLTIARGGFNILEWGVV